MMTFFIANFFFLFYGVFLILNGWSFSTMKWSWSLFLLKIVLFLSSISRIKTLFPYFVGFHSSAILVRIGCVIGFKFQTYLSTWKATCSLIYIIICPFFHWFKCHHHSFKYIYPCVCFQANHYIQSSCITLL